MTVLIIYNEHSLTLQIVKKIYSIFMMLAMAVVALSFTACSSDDDEDDGGDGSGNESGTVIIDGESYYTEVYGSNGTLSFIEQTNGRGMWWTIWVSKSSMFGYDDARCIELWFPQSRVSEFTVGQVFDSDEIDVRHFGNRVSFGIPYNSWGDVIQGSIKILSIGKTEIEISIDSLTIEKNGERHTIKGILKLKNSVVDTPFDDE